MQTYVGLDSSVQGTVGAGLFISPDVLPVTQQTATEH